MMTASCCDCLICRLEASLIAELSDGHSDEDFRLFAVLSPILSGFPDALELVRKLQDHENHGQNPSSDAILLDLLGRGNDPQFRPMWQRLLLLVFVPTVHRTTSQIVTAFPSLTRDDTAQYLFAALLEFLHSKDLRSRRSHLGFTIARKIRRSAFRWAIRESHRSPRDETDRKSVAALETHRSDHDPYANILLRQFLDNCQRRGWLSTGERDLLTQFKLDGVSCTELARRNGHSAIAIRHRIQRLLDRLRRIAQTSERGTPQQLDLFAP
jgi:DNA-directed RNA polymerase specialized sigma24 family protein